MPELPEVEVTRRSVAQGLAGARVRRVELGLPLRWPLGIAPAALEGAVAGAMTRRGKYLWLPLADEGTPASGGPDAGGLLIHLGMSGALSFGPVPQPPGPHDHFRLVTDRGCLRLTDPRRFGAVVWSASRDVDPARKLLAGLGPEPFDPVLDATRFHASLKQRRAPVKAALLAGEVVVGAGNIYACEALWLARIDPRTPANRLGAARAGRLLEAVRQVLGRAIEAGGSTLRDFNANGAAGHYQAEAHVYGRAGEPCHACGAPVRRIVQGQRATYFCGRCQKR
jgi:formamidopyrimidine-DNA glycosylase